MQKKLEKLAKKKPFKELQLWIKAIVNHVGGLVPIVKKAWRSYETYGQAFCTTLPMYTSGHTLRQRTHHVPTHRYLLGK